MKQKMLNTESSLDGAYMSPQKVIFPTFTGVSCNMMPVLHGDVETWPKPFQQYFEFSRLCSLPSASTVYLTVHESFVQEGMTQRRSGIHTDGTSRFGWGGGGWGGKGIYMASSDGRCRFWPCETHDVDGHGALLSVPSISATDMEPNMIYHMSDRTPHESLPALISGPRQFFRLVGPEVDAWWALHSTPNPLGIKPQCKVLEYNKFTSLI